MFDQTPITLTDDETALIRRIRAQAERDRITADYFERLRNTRPPVYDAATAWKHAKAQLDQMLADENKTWITDDHNRRVITLLGWYFGQDPNFETDIQPGELPRSLAKGIMLYGPIGCGKTRLMEAFAGNTRQSYLMADCRTIADDFTRCGAEVIDQFNILVPTKRPDLSFGQRALSICFDDLGTESEAGHYKNTRNVLAEIIQNRYTNLLLRRNTHYTTNLTPADLKANYGPRAFDRLRDSVNVIAFPAHADSRRG